MRSLTLALATLAFACVATICSSLVTAPPARAEGCEFVLGFKAMHDLIPDKVGDCKTDEYHNPYNGDGLQETTGGLLVWRKSDNWTAFTDGYHTWLNGPSGLQQRLNTERFPWEDPVSNPQEFVLTPADAAGFQQYPDSGKPMTSNESTGLRAGFQTVLYRETQPNGVSVIFDGAAAYKDADAAHVILSLGSMNAAQGKEIAKVDGPTVGDESYSYTYRYTYDTDRGKMTFTFYGLEFRKGRVLSYVEVGGLEGVNIDQAAGYARIVESRIPQN
jgi:hypothetical protein